MEIGTRESSWGFRPKFDRRIHQLQASGEATVHTRHVLYILREHTFPEGVPLCHFLKADSGLNEPYVKDIQPFGEEFGFQDL